MRTTIGRLAAVALVAGFGVSARAQDDAKPEDRNDVQRQNDRQQGDRQQGDRRQDRQGDATRERGVRGSGESQTIRGIIAGVTVVGETSINYETNTAEVAEVSLINVIGHPVRDGMGRQANRGGQGDQPSDRQRGERDSGTAGNRQRGDQGSSDARRDQDQDQERDHKSSADQDDPNRARGGREASGAGGARPDREGDQAGRDGDRGRRADRLGSAMGGGHRANLYVLAITPQTRVRSSSAAGGGASSEHGGQSSFEKLEIGDRIEVTIKGGAQPVRRGRETSYGRHRIFRGVASAITVQSTPDRESRREGHGDRARGSAEGGQPQAGQNDRGGQTDRPRSNRREGDRDSDTSSRERKDRRSADRPN